MGVQAAAGIPVPPRRERGVGEKVVDALVTNEERVADVKRNADAKGNNDGTLTRDEFDAYKREKLGPEFLGIHWFADFKVSKAEQLAIAAVSHELGDAESAKAKP